MGSLVNSSEKLIDTTEVLKDDLGPLYVDIPQFHETFFGNIPELEKASKVIFNKFCEGSRPLFRDGWTGWSEGAQQSAVIGFLENTFEQLALWAKDHRPLPARWLIAEPNKSLKGSTAPRKLDVGFATHPAPTHWSQILIPGELKSNIDKDRIGGAWLDIGKYVREVFYSQETRRFVLAFTLYGPLMRVWEFDRLGGIASTQFDINKEGLRFVSTILGFLWMEEELVFDPTVITANNKQFIEIIRNGTQERIVIDELMTRVGCIAGRATTCWKAHPEEDPSTTLVIKDSWQYPERDEEGELFREVTRLGVRNVARYYHHETIFVNGNVDDIHHGIRKGLDITKASNYRSQHIGLHQDLGPHSISNDSATSQKRSSSQISASLPPSKRPRSESSIETNYSTLLNRVHRRVIVCDYGQRIVDASSPMMLLVGLQGHLEGHNSLFFKAGILHRDISINNLMINEDRDNKSQVIFMIDMDSAAPKDGQTASGARWKTGTRAFMAIGVLRGEKNTYRHDLESFFWVIFWICIHYNGKREVKNSQFQMWNFIDMERLGNEKHGLVLNPHFNDRLAKDCQPYYKSLIPCVNRFREVLFLENEQVKHDVLYFKVWHVFREA